jgi:hypothetical protein
VSSVLAHPFISVNKWSLTLHLQNPKPEIPQKKKIIKIHKVTLKRHRPSIQKGEAGGLRV